MTDQGIVAVLWHYVQNSRKFGVYPGLAGLWVTIEQAADRIANQETHILALQREIQNLRSQNEQLREAAAMVAKESAELLEKRQITVAEQLRAERDRAVRAVKEIAKEGKVWMCPYCNHCVAVVDGFAACDVEGQCAMPYSRFEFTRENERSGV